MNLFESIIIFKNEGLFNFIKQTGISYSMLGDNFAVFCSDAHKLRIIKQFAFDKFNLDSLIEVGPKRTVFELLNNGEEKCLGTLVLAKNRPEGNFYYNKGTDQYFVIKPFSENKTKIVEKIRKGTYHE